MNKKPLIVVSICAVVLLVMGSLSNVVGYQSVKSTVNDSPLFSMRTQRAINMDGRRLLTSEYLGKGENILLIPMADDKTLLYQKVINRIDRMNETTFNNFITMVIHQINREPKLKNINSQEIIAFLHQIRNNPNILSNQNVDLRDEMPVVTSGSFIKFIGCVFSFITSIILLLVWGPFVLLYLAIFSSNFGTCNQYTCDCNILK